jgi:hypothetical protein
MGGEFRAPMLENRNVRQRARSDGLNMPLPSRERTMIEVSTHEPGRGIGRFEYRPRGLPACTARPAG